MNSPIGSNKYVDDFLVLFLACKFGWKRLQWMDLGGKRPDIIRTFHVTKVIERDILFRL